MRTRSLRWQPCPTVPTPGERAGRLHGAGRNMQQGTLVDAFGPPAQCKGVMASKHLHLCICTALCMPAACLLPPSVTIPTQKQGTRNRSPCLCLTAYPRTARFSPVARTTLFAGTLFLFPARACCGAGTCPPPSPLPSPPLALCWLAAFHPAEPPCPNPPGTGTHVCQLAAEQRTAWQHSPCRAPTGGRGQRWRYSAMGEAEGAVYLVLLSPDDLRRRFDLVHVLMERVPGLFICDF